jgi:hypothetical protein
MSFIPHLLPAVDFFKILENGGDRLGRRGSEVQILSPRLSTWPFGFIRMAICALEHKFFACQRPLYAEVVSWAVLEGNRTFPTT